MDATAATKLEENSLAGYMTISLENRPQCRYCSVIEVPRVEALIDFVCAFILKRSIGDLDGLQYLAVQNSSIGDLAQSVTTNTTE